MIKTSSYLKENKQIMKKLKHTSFTQFWKNYIYKNTAVHDLIPYHNLLLTKMPCDMFIYPDIIFHNKPDTIIEIGTGRGGSTIWFSDLIPDGKVITMDVNKPSEKTLQTFKEKNIVFIHGDATTHNVYEQVFEHIGNNVLVIDDGSHKTQDVYTSFKLFHGMVPLGGFYIVEDGMAALLFKDRPKTLPNDAINSILEDYPTFKLFTEYDKFVFGTMYRGVLKRNERNKNS